MTPPTPVPYRLDWPSTAHAAYVGAMRQVSAMRRERPSEGGSHERIRDPWLTNIEGAGAELAGSQLTGLAWNALRAKLRGLADLGDDVEVRWTHHDAGGLLFRPDDEPDRRYILVTGALPAYVLHGWLYGHEVLDDGQQVGADDDPSRYWLHRDRDALRAMTSLEGTRLAVGA